MERQHDDGALVPDDLPQGFATVRQLHPIDLEVEDPEILADMETPVSAFLKIDDGRHSFLHGAPEIHHRGVESKRR